MAVVVRLLHDTYTCFKNAQMWPVMHVDRRTCRQMPFFKHKKQKHILQKRERDKRLSNELHSVVFAVSLGLAGRTWVNQGTKISVGSLKRL